MKPRYKRALALSAGLAALGTALALVFNAFNSKLVFFFSPSQVMAREAPLERSFRIGGLVERGSVQRDAAAPTLRFVVTDKAHQVPVSFNGPLPDLFGEGRGVVARGRLGGDGLFRADQLLAKHDENYTPPKAAQVSQRALPGPDKAPPGLTPRQQAPVTKPYAARMEEASP